MKQLLGNCEANAGSSSQLYFLPWLFNYTLEKCHSEFAYFKVLHAHKSLLWSLEMKEEQRYKGPALA
jgi:hypothetical protein